MTETANCIYCGKAFNPSKGKGDHIIPAAWGEFRDDVRFRGLCTSCNNEIGKSEEQLLQCGPERKFREWIIPASSRSRGKKASWIGAQGAPPPQYRALTNEGVLKARLAARIGEVKALDQFVIHDEEGESYPIEIFPGISAASLKKKVKALGVKAKDIDLYCNDDISEHYNQIFREAFPKIQMERKASTDPGIRKVEISEQCQTSEAHYFRAIAKIAFHYYLIHSIRFYGHEACFSAIRDFIRNGIGTRKNIFSDKLFFRDIDTHCLPSWWVHTLAARELNGIATGYVCLFRGPEFKGSEHQVILGQLPYSPIISPKVAWAHSYEYDRPVPSKGKVGNVRSVQVTRI